MSPQRISKVFRVAMVMPCKALPRCNYGRTCGFCVDAFPQRTPSLGVNTDLSLWQQYSVNSKDLYNLRMAFGLHTSANCCCSIGSLVRQRKAYVSLTIPRFPPDDGRMSCSTRPYNGRSGTMPTRHRGIVARTVRSIGGQRLMGCHITIARLSAPVLLMLHNINDRPFAMVAKFWIDTLLKLIAGI